MASERPGETLGQAPALGKRRSVQRRSDAASAADDEDDEEAQEERDIRELEREVGELGRRILESRRTVPDALLQALSSRLLDLRPPPAPSSQTLALADAEMRAPSDAEGTLHVEADEEMLEKLHALRTKVASNIAAMPTLLKRTNECITQIEKLEQCNVNIHSVFTRNRR